MNTFVYSEILVLPTPRSRLNHVVMLARMLLLIFPVVLLFSCQSDDRPGQEETAWDDLMAVHDEVMPRMSDLARAKSGINSYLEENPGLPDSTRLRLENQTSEIDQAQESMMNWMNQLISPLDKLREGREHEEVMAYLEKEQGLIEGVRDEMLITLEKSEAILRELGTEDQ